MAKFKVGDKVRRSISFRGEGGWTLGDKVLTVTEVSAFVAEAWLETDDPLGSGFAHRFDLIATHIPRMGDHKAEYRARANDPATSKAAGKPTRLSLRERVQGILCHGHSATGTEIAEQLGARLNSVTPRLAELRRAGKIKDSGQRRDKQIVWVLA